MNKNNISLSYKKINRKSEEGVFLEEIAPYGGHLKNTKIKPPLYSVKPDVLIISDNIMSALIAIFRAVQDKKTVYFHPVFLDEKRALSGYDDIVAKKYLWKIKSVVKNNSKLVMYLDANATIFPVFSKNNDFMVFLSFFDYGDMDKNQINNSLLLNWRKTFSNIFNREKMIWNSNELPGSIISFLWSKRVIVPKKVQYIVEKNNDNDFLLKKIATINHLN